MVQIANKRIVAESISKHTIKEVRQNIPSSVRDVENGQEVKLTRKCELVNCRKLDQLNRVTRSFGDAYREFMDIYNLAELRLNPDEVFGGLRDQTAGRETPWNFEEPDFGVSYICISDTLDSDYL